MPSTAQSRGSQESSRGRKVLITVVRALLWECPLRGDKHSTEEPLLTVSLALFRDKVTMTLETGFLEFQVRQGQLREHKEDGGAGLRDLPVSLS